MCALEQFLVQELIPDNVGKHNAKLKFVFKKKKKKLELELI